MIFFEKIGEMRPNQFITTFGPGSIIDALNDSLTILDLSYWEKKNLGKEIFDARLASYMNVKHFYMPKSGGKEDLPVIAFPYYHVCSNKKCQYLFDMRENFKLDEYNKNNGQVKCPICGWDAYPSRFITICEDGHMDDFPWRWWVHRGSTTCNRKLTLVSNGQTSSLAELTVKCECGAKRTMAGAMQKENFEELQCTANHPHRPITSPVHIKPCANHVIPSQRGASNVYFSVTRSAISIPPWTDPINNVVSENRIVIENYEQDFGEVGLQKAYEKFFAASGYTREEFDAAYKRLKDKVKEYTELKEMEYKAITHHEDTAYQHNVKYFKTEEEPVLDSLKPYIMRVIKIHRLREVSVLTGFTRLEAPEPEIEDESQKHIVKLQCNDSTEKWLPAVEINGEGIFIELNKDSVATWLQIPKVAERSKLYENFYAAYCEKRGWQNYKPRDAKYVLLHTLAHILIKEMAIKSGYSSTAIRERIYSSTDMCGLLIYTGAADKEGSLGGLVELGKMNKFIPLLKSALENALVCTTDPECLMKKPTKDSLNGASCHSCTMISETACENGNRLLDRALVVPLPEHEGMGFFEKLTEDLCGIQV